MIPIDHPAVLCAVIVARSGADGCAGSPISAIALFTVAAPGANEPQFRLAKAAVPPGTSQAAVIAALCDQIPAGAQVLVQELREDAAIGLRPCDPDDLPEHDNDLLACFLRHAGLVPFAVSDAQLAAVGRGIGLAMPESGSAPAKRSHYAPHSAMALWATYVVAFCSEEEATAMLAAFRAWHALQKETGGKG